MVDNYVFPKLQSSRQMFTTMTTSRVDLYDSSQASSCCDS